MKKRLKRTHAAVLAELRAVDAHKGATLLSSDWREGVCFALRWTVGYTHGDISPSARLKRNLEVCNHPQKVPYTENSTRRGSHRVWFYCKRCQIWNAGEEAQRTRPAGLAGLGRGR